MPHLQRLRLYLRAVNEVLTDAWTKQRNWAQKLTCDVVFGIERCGLLT
jgi:hypothetical protein